MYIVLEKNYLTYTSKEVYKCYNLNECHNKVEELSQLFIELKQGQLNSEIYFKLKPKSGYYMRKSKCFNKISIYNKTIIKGFFANEILISKVLSYEIIKVLPNDFEVFDYNLNSDHFEHFKSNVAVQRLIDDLNNDIAEVKVEEVKNEKILD